MDVSSTCTGDHKKVTRDARHATGIPKDDAHHGAEVIAWDVELWPYAERITDQPAFQRSVKRILSEDAGATLAANPWTSRARKTGDGDLVVVLRVLAATDVEAEAAASAIVMRAFGKAVDEVVGVQDFGWTVACKPRPTWDVK